MGDDEGTIGSSEALAMLEAFASVGASRFDLTCTNSVGEKISFRSHVPLPELTRTLPALIESATARHHNVILRPHGVGIAFIQLDDLKGPSESVDPFARLAPAVFLALETSPRNFQAWVALKGAEDKDFARRLRKGAGADPTASGATRVTGSVNFKEKYAPQFPRVRIHQVNLGRLATAKALEQLGLVSAREERQSQAIPLPAPMRGPGTGNGRTMRAASKVPHPRTTAAGPISAGRISCGA